MALGCTTPSRSRRTTVNGFALPVGPHNPAENVTMPVDNPPALKLSSPFISTDPFELKPRASFLKYVDTQNRNGLPAPSGAAPSSTTVPDTLAAVDALMTNPPTSESTTSKLTGSTIRLASGGG